MLIDSKTPGSRRAETRGQGSSSPRPSQESSEQGFAPSSGRKEPTPSSTRPPPPHPILKKSRGPSSSGPRPTARFASPPASSDEAVHDGGIISANTATAIPEMPPPPLPSSAKQNQDCAPATALPALNAPQPPATVPAASTTTPAVAEPEMPPPVVPPTRVARPSATTGRRIVATTAASKRKPTVVRRHSSHSSTGSDSGPRVAGFVTASKRSGSKRSTPTASQLLGQGSLSSQASDPGISEKAAGKRPARTATTKQPLIHSTPDQAKAHQEEPAVTQQLPLTGPQRRSTWDVRDSGASREVAGGRRAVIQQTRGSPSQIATQGPPPPVAGFVNDDRSRQRAPPMVRSSSTTSERSRRLREPGLALLPSQATSSVATFTTPARGQFDSEPVTSAPVVPEAKDIPDGVLLGSQPSSSVLGVQFKPTPPNPAPPIPFGRSRSELALLLKRGQPGNGEDA
jgi:hypothetical protein